MDANDFMVLSALLRNLAAPKMDVICRATSLTPGRVIDPALQGAARCDNGREKADRPLRIQPDERRKRPKTKGMFRRAKRNVSHASRKSLESLSAPNQRFRWIVCFQGLNCLFVSPVFACAASNETPRFRIVNPVDLAQGFKAVTSAHTSLKGPSSRRVWHIAGMPR
jgi:hypothetical protein